MAFLRFFLWASDIPFAQIWGGTFDDESFDLSHDAPGAESEEDPRKCVVKTTWQDRQVIKRWKRWNSKSARCHEEKAERLEASRNFDNRSNMAMCASHLQTFFPTKKPVDKDQRPHIAPTIEPKIPPSKIMGWFPIIGGWSGMVINHGPFPGIYRARRLPRDAHDARSLEHGESWAQHQQLLGLVGLVGWIDPWDSFARYSPI